MNTKVFVERVIYEREENDIRRERAAANSKFIQDQEFVPEGAGGFMSDGSLKEMRDKKVPSCADVVVTSRRPDGKTVFLSSFRTNPNGGNPGFWWMQGGMLSAGQSIERLLGDRLKKEGGIVAASFVFAGLYRTVSERGTFCDTVQPCYFVHVPWEEAQKAATDKDHGDVRFFSQEEYDALPEDQINWYPKRLFSLALRTAP